MELERKILLALLAAIVLYSEFIFAETPPRLRNRLRQKRIVGGLKCAIQSAPYQVSIFRSEKLHCGGSIISRTHILTAAHCVCQPDTAVSAYRIKSSSDSSSAEDGKVHLVDKIHCHEKYKPGLLPHDIAVVVLAKPFRYRDCRDRVSMVEYGDGPLAEQMGLVTGWGKTEDNNQSPSLISANVPVIQWEICKRLYREENFPKGAFCAGYLGIGGRDSCLGDSGGPFVIQGKLAGIVSYGPAICGDPFKPGIYTSVAFYRKWINEKVKQP